VHTCCASVAPCTLPSGLPRGGGRGANRLPPCMLPSMLPMDPIDGKQLPGMPGPFPNHDTGIQPATAITCGCAHRVASTHRALQVLIVPYCLKGCRGLLLTVGCILPRLLAGSPRPPLDAVPPARALERCRADAQRRCRFLRPKQANRQVWVKHCLCTTSRTT